MDKTERRKVNAAEVEIKPGVFVPLCKALALIKALQLDSPKVRKDHLTPAAQELWL